MRKKKDLYCVLWSVTYGSSKSIIFRLNFMIMILKIKNKK